MTQMSVRGSLLLASLALFLLVFGAGIYITLRPPLWASGLTSLGLTYSYELKVPAGLRHVAGYLPSFLHVAIFTTLTYACCSMLSRKRAIAIALGWTAVNVVFEVGQALKPSFPFDAVTAYLRNGTFDSSDVLASLAGGLATFILVERVLKWREANEPT